jgi:cytochrome c oxidase subunit 3
MILPPRFTGDLAKLPTHAFGHRSLTWWGIIAFMLIEGTGFGMAFAAYFFLMGTDQSWPPEPFPPPDLLAGTLFTIFILLTEILNTAIKKAAEEEKLRPVQIGLIAMTLAGLPLFVCRFFEFRSLHISWTDNAYGSMIWVLLVLHTTHILTDWVDTVVLAALMHTKHGPTGRRFVDTSENALYWRFVWLAWLPIYLMIYWIPRWVG